MTHIRWRQSSGKFVCESNIVAPLGLAEVSSRSGLLRTEQANLGGVISEGGCCDLGNFSKICMTGKRLSESILTNARTWLYLYFSGQSGSWRHSLGYEVGQDC